MSISLASSQFISDVLEYTPAPGQFTNSTPWGNPASSASIIGGVNGTMCLGAFGGYVIFRFENPVENHPDNPYGVDFTVFGNPLIHWSEPGIVWVMKDENGNELPDDIWIELAGSDYHFSTSAREYEVTYTNPMEPIASDVPWIDNAGNNGSVPANNIHNQPYYPDHDSFPSIPVEAYSLMGSSIYPFIDFTSGPGVLSKMRSFGYADNFYRGSPPYTIPDNPFTDELENSGGDAFDISWAVDAGGEYVELDKIHFVKIQNAVHTFGGWLGELSTEVTGAVDVSPDPSVTGELDMIVIRDLPVEIETSSYQLEVFVYHSGRVQPGGNILWTSNMKGATVSEDHLLTIIDPGILVLTASLAGRPEVSTSVTTNITLAQTALPENSDNHPNIILNPNPAHSQIWIPGAEGASVSIFDTSGKCWFQIDSYEEHSKIDISRLPRGLFVVLVTSGDRTERLKLMKN